MTSKKLEKYSFVVQWCGLALLFIPCFAFTEVVRYNLYADFDNPLVVYAEVDTSSLGKFTLQKPRVLSLSSKTQYPEIQCKTEQGLHKVEFAEEMECRQISWTINFEPLDTDATVVSKQRNLYSSAGWWVLFEWGDIPRLKGLSHVEVCANILKAKFSKKCQMLPKLNSPPLLISWGRASAIKFISNIKFSIYLDDAQRIMKEESWLKLLLTQYKYLQQLLVDNNAPKHSIDIIWVGIDKKNGTVSGAAGSNAFISNYMVTNKFVSQNSLSLLHWVSAHEVFHMLTTQSYSLWVSESLAHYYGYKSLKQSGNAFKTPLEIWQKEVVSVAHPNTGLYKANQMVEIKNDMSYYSLFYLKGAAFWQELDGKLIKNATALDEYIALLQQKDSTIFQLNEEFLLAIERVLGKKEVASLVSKYLQ